MVAVFRDGDVSTILTGDVDEIERALAPVVAAAPGYVRLHYEGEGDDGPLIDRTPVVAWRITGNGAIPVSPVKMSHGSTTPLGCSCQTGGSCIVRRPTRRREGLAKNRGLPGQGEGCLTLAVPFSSSAH